MLVHLWMGGLALGIGPAVVSQEVPREARCATAGSNRAAVLGFEAACRAPGSAMAPLVAQQGLPEHVLATERGELVLVHADVGGARTTVAWFDRRGGYLGHAELGALDPRRAPHLREAAPGVAVVVPLADGTHALVDLDAGIVVLDDGAERRRLLIAADARARSGDVAGAVQGYEDALAVDPTDPEAWRALARALDQSGAPDRARDVLARATETVHGGRVKPVSMDWRVCDPRARLAFELVTRYEREGDTERALAALSDVERLYPCMEEATLHKAALALASDPLAGPDRADEALRATIRRLECPRARAAAHLDAATFHERAGALDHARAHLAEALELGEQREVVLQSLARIDTERGEFALAVRSLEALRERWLADQASVADPRRRERSSERLARLERELAALRLQVAVADPAPTRR